MKPQTALTPDQMHELQSLGLDCSDASMVCINFNGTYAYVGGEEAEAIKDCINGKFYVEISPAYTLEDILMKLREISPKYRVEPNMSDWFYSVSYPTTDRCGSIKLFTALNNPMKPAFEMLKWALQNHPDKIKKL